MTVDMLKAMDQERSTPEPAQHRLPNFSLP